MAFRDQIRLAFSSTFKKQTTQGTALADAEMDASLTAAVISPTREARSLFLRDCSNQYLRRKETVARLRRMTLEIPGVSAHILGGFAAAALGTAAAPTGTTTKTHAITMLGPSVRLLSLHTFMVGHEDGTGEAWKWYDVAVDSWRASAAAGDDTRYTLTVNLVGSGARGEETGWTWPACIDETPMKLYDGDFSIDGTSYMDSLKSVAASYSNGILTGDAPFVGGSLDVKRMLRSPVRTYAIEAAILGSDRPGDALNDILVANDDAGTEADDIVLEMGAVATNGVTCTVPTGYVSVADQSEAYYGEAEESVLNVLVEPTKEAGNASSPLSLTVVVPSSEQTPAFEVAA
jgi:hypothetical protein